MSIKITESKGVHFEFANGLCVSVQMGKRNACSNRDEIKDKNDPHYDGFDTVSEDAAVHIWDTKNGVVLTREIAWELFSQDLGKHEEEFTYVSPENVAAILDFCAKR